MIISRSLFKKCIQCGARKIDMLSIRKKANKTMSWLIALVVAGVITFATRTLKYRQDKHMLKWSNPEEYGPVHHANAPQEPTYIHARKHARIHTYKHKQNKRKRHPVHIKRISPLIMMSSNGSIFRVTGPLCGEFTGPRWIPLTKASDAVLWCFLWSAPE